MNILILGGTQFIGRHIAETLLAAGHAVTVFTRGRTPDELPPAVKRLRGDRDTGPAALRALGAETWDACVDVSGYLPRQVRPSAALLRSRVARYIFISAVAVYGDPTERPVRETHPRVQPAAEDETELDGVLYARAKVACENIVRETFGDRAAILRPQIVVGPHDPSGRYTYWLQRARQGGEMLAPGDGTDHLQLIDVRDVARFVQTAIERDLAGAFNLAGPRITWANFMRLLGVGNPTWVSAGILKHAGITEFELPLYRPERGPRSGLMDVCNEHARAAGLMLTPPELTLRETRACMAGRTSSPPLTPEREAQLLRATRRA